MFRILPEAMTAPSMASEEFGPSVSHFVKYFEDA
jgi:hypothetical protein